MSDQETKIGKRNNLHTIPDGEPAGEENTVSSARRSSAGSTTASGSMSLSGGRIREGLAREILYRRFTTYGAKLQTDFPFHMGEVLCTLDGFDPNLRLGYAYISHADADVVTDMDSDTELALHELMRDGAAFILVVHDSQMPTSEELVIFVDKFLRDLPPELRPHGT